MTRQETKLDYTRQEDKRRDEMSREDTRLDKIRDEKIRRETRRDKSRPENAIFPRRETHGSREYTFV